MIHVVHGNAMDYLEGDHGLKFDAVISDPPYASGGGTLAERQKATSEKYTLTKRSCPYPDFLGDGMDQRAWVRMMRQVLEAARLRCAPGAVLALFIDWRQYAALTDAAQWAGWLLRGAAVWDKMTSRPQKGRFRQQAEFILWGSNGPLPSDRNVPCLPGVFREVNVPPGKRMHQTQKPIEVMRQVVQLCSPGGMILDPFCGSGSTLEAARLEGYSAVGVEASPQIAKTAADRLCVAVERAAIGG